VACDDACLINRARDGQLTMNRTNLLASAVAACVLVASPAAAHAAHGPAPDPTPVVVTDPVCATDGTNCQPQPDTHGPDPVCATDGTNCGAAAVHVVARGEWLWKIARTRLAAAGKSTAPRNVRRVADMIHADNRRVIGSNKNRLRPGQRLSIRAVNQWPV
jgi:Tfp pilus assembly protein FimV